MVSNYVRNAIDGSKFNRHHLAIVIISVLIVVFEGYDLVVFGSIVPQIMEEWSITPVQAGVLGSYGLVGMLIGSIVLGALSDKIGRVNVLVFSVIVFSIFTALMGLAADPAQFATFRFIAGVGIGGAMPNVLALVSEFVPKARRTTLIAFTMTGMQMGSMLAPTLGILLIPSFGWRPLLFVALIPLLLVPFIIKYVPDSLNLLVAKGNINKLETLLEKIAPGIDRNHIIAEKSESTSTQPKITVVDLFKNKLAVSTVMIWIVYFMGLLMIFGLNTWLPSLIREAVPALQTGLVFLIVLNGSAILGTVVFGLIAEKKDAKKQLIIIYLVGAFAIALLGFTTNIPLLYLFSAIAGISTTGAQNLLNAFTSQYYPHHMRSTALGFANGVGRIGGMVGPTFGGVLLTLSLPSQFNFIAFGIPGAIIALALIFVATKKAPVNTAIVKEIEILPEPLPEQIK